MKTRILLLLMLITCQLQGQFIYNNGKSTAIADTVKAKSGQLFVKGVTNFNSIVKQNTDTLSTQAYVRSLSGSFIYDHIIPEDKGINYRYASNKANFAVNPSLLYLSAGYGTKFATEQIFGGNQYGAGSSFSWSIGNSVDAQISMAFGMDMLQLNVLQSPNFKGIVYNDIDTTKLVDNSLPTYRMLKNAVKSPLTDGIWKSNGSTFAAYANSASAPSNSFFTEFSGNLAYKGDFESEAYFCRGGSGNFTYLFAGGLMVTWGGQEVMTLYPTIADEVNGTVYKLGSKYALTASGMKLLSVENGGVKKYTVDLDGQPEVQTAGKGIILKSPNGTRYKITVDNSGALTATAL